MIISILYDYTRQKIMPEPYAPRVGSQGNEAVLLFSNIYTTLASTALYKALATCIFGYTRPHVVLTFILGFLFLPFTISEIERLPTSKEQILAGPRPICLATPNDFVLAFARSLCFLLKP